jgi:hypothetical protein
MYARGSGEFGDTYFLPALVVQQLAGACEPSGRDAGGGFTLWYGRGHETECE